MSGRLPNNSERSAFNGRGARLPRVRVFGLGAKEVSTAAASADWSCPSTLRDSLFTLDGYSSSYGGRGSGGRDPRKTGTHTGCMEATAARVVVAHRGYGTPYGLVRRVRPRRCWTLARRRLGRRLRRLLYDADPTGTGTASWIGSAGSGAREGVPPLPSGQMSAFETAIAFKGRRWYVVSSAAGHPRRPSGLDSRNRWINDIV